jgi:nucleotide-binding universal stress UspA family protein
MFNKLIIGVDGSSGGEDAIALAQRLAGSDASLILTNVCQGGDRPPVRGDSGAYEEFLRTTSRRLLESIRSQAGVDAEILVAPAPTVGKGLRQAAQSRSADLIVVGSSQHARHGWVHMADHARAALNGAPCAVALAPIGYRERQDEIMDIGVGYDGSAESRQAMEAARGLAARSGARNHAMAVVSLESLPAGVPVPDDWPHVAAQLVEEELHRWDEVPDVEGDAVYGDPSEELAQFSQKLDLLVVGSRAEGAIGRLLHGSTANYLARHAHCPLLVLRRGASDGATSSEPANRNETAVPAAQ